MEYPHKFSKIINDIKADYQLCNDALRDMATKHKSSSCHNSNPLLCAMARFIGTLRVLTETCNHAAEGIVAITQQIRAAETAIRGDADAVLSTPIRLKSTELAKYLQSSARWAHVIDNGYIGADYRQHMDALQAVWVEFEYVGWHCTQTTDLAVENFNQQHKIIILILHKGEQDAVHEMYQRSLQPTVELVPVAYFLDYMEGLPLKAEGANIRHVNEDDDGETPWMIELAL